jgi:hypothetical protein
MDGHRAPACAWRRGSVLCRPSRSAEQRSGHARTLHILRAVWSSSTSASRQDAAGGSADCKLSCIVRTSGARRAPWGRAAWATARPPGSCPRCCRRPRRRRRPPAPPGQPAPAGARDCAKAPRAGKGVAAPLLLLAPCCLWQTVQLCLSATLWRLESGCTYQQCLAVTASLASTASCSNNSLCIIMSFWLFGCLPAIAVRNSLFFSCPA